MTAACIRNAASAYMLHTLLHGIYKTAMGTFRVIFDVATVVGNNYRIFRPSQVCHMNTSFYKIYFV